MGVFQRMHKNETTCAEAFQFDFGVRGGAFMTNEELKAEMKVLVDVEGVLKPAKVIDARTLKVGNQAQ